MKLSISPLNSNPLPEFLRYKLIRKYAFMPDIGVRMATLPQIPLGKLLGTGQANTPHENAFNYARENSVDLYVGYLILSTNTAEDMILHSFCVKNNKVIEPSAGIEWRRGVRYIGQKADKSSMKYLDDFNRLMV